MVPLDGKGWGFICKRRCLHPWIVFRLLRWPIGHHSRASLGHSYYAPWSFWNPIHHRWIVACTIAYGSLMPNAYKCRLWSISNKHWLNVRQTHNTYIGCTLCLGGLFVVEFIQKREHRKYWNCTLTICFKHGLLKASKLVSGNKISFRSRTAFRSTLPHVSVVLWPVNTAYEPIPFFFY